MATVLFLHGWNSKPGGVKPSYLAEHGHTVINPALPDEDFAESVRIAQAEFDQHHPEVVVGSSRGGAVAMNVDAKGAALVLALPGLEEVGNRDDGQARHGHPPFRSRRRRPDRAQPRTRGPERTARIGPRHRGQRPSAGRPRAPGGDARGRRANELTSLELSSFRRFSQLSRFPWSDWRIAGKSTPKLVRRGHRSPSIAVDPETPIEMMARERTAWESGCRCHGGGDGLFWVSSAAAALLHGRPGQAAAEIKLGKDFLGGVVEKLPPTSFDKADKYRGTVHSYRLVAIDPRTPQVSDRLPDRGGVSSSGDRPDLGASRPEPANARRVAEVSLRRQGAGQHRARGGRSTPVSDRDR